MKLKLNSSSPLTHTFLSPHLDSTLEQECCDVIGGVGFVEEQPSDWWMRCARFFCQSADQVSCVCERLTGCTANGFDQYI